MAITVIIRKLTPQQFLSTSVCLLVAVTAAYSDQYRYGMHLKVGHGAISHHLIKTKLVTVWRRVGTFYESESLRLLEPLPARPAWERQ